jgi:hypothetical protein
MRVWCIFQTAAARPWFAGTRRGSVLPCDWPNSILPSSDTEGNVFPADIRMDYIEMGGWCKGKNYFLGQRDKGQKERNEIKDKDKETKDFTCRRGAGAREQTKENIEL